MSIKALAPWFGGKRNLAPVIAEELGDHACYWEPFCGSMSVLLAKPPVTMETVNDLHGDLINLAKVIQDRTLGPLLYRTLRRTLMHEALYRENDQWMREHEADPIDAPDVERAFRYFIVSWLGRNGTAGTPTSHKGTYCVRYTRNGGHAATRFRNTIASIPAWRRRLERVTIIQRDGFETIDRIGDDDRTAIYLDPPYLVKGAKYLHDFDAWDHHRLSRALERFTKARVVVSYYDHPRLAQLYPADRWTKRCITVSKAMAHQGRRGANDTKAVEVLLINGPLNSEVAK